MSLQEPRIGGVSRRKLLAGSLGVGGALALGGGLAGCGGGSGSGSKTITLGSSASDAVPKKATAAIMADFGKKNGYTVKINTVDHNTFQEQINNYLQGRPDDVMTWFAGYRMRFFAKKGLLGDISDVWSQVGGQFSDAMKKASTGEDGKQYFIPLDNYAWAIFYRKSVFQQHGYQIPKTWDQYVALSKQMQKDNLPVAFADQDGWPAFGTFDYLNMRINGYQFHIDLMGGKQAWDGPKVAKVFDTWKQILPYYQTGALGRTWQEAAQALLQKKAGMYLLGGFVAQQFTNKADLDDLDFFPFPEIDSTVGTDAVEAPIDGYMMAKRPKNEDGAKKLLTYLSSAAAEENYLKIDSSNIAVNKGASTASYNPLQKKQQELIAAAKSISQFLDRDADPTFASTVAIPSFQEFLKNPNNIASTLKKMEQQKKSIYSE
ncbi:ABC transporter substrate-binding protein [Fodinicola acaciae]|uniref:ABC transporter substrate-binding protein n=1 Tax=Fodinicola acaciae TaxID=2681555 RepID=UPI0013D61105|nr:ABC transporter substrate-binding protein [Fodinicola acaciae]